MGEVWLPIEMLGELQKCCYQKKRQGDSLQHPSTCPESPGRDGELGCRKGKNRDSGGSRRKAVAVMVLVENVRKTGGSEGDRKGKTQEGSPRDGGANSFFLEAVFCIPQHQSNSK